MSDQRGYWDRVAEDKTSTHPIDPAWLTASIDRDARILDFGCGYGRTLAELAALGWRDTVGVDLSPNMIARGRRMYPKLDLRVAAETAFAAAAFDAIFAFAVFTCIPGDAAQDALMAELRRLLRPGGHLYFSDMPLQDDARNRRRYVEARSVPFGVFETEDGAVVRHHTEARLAALLAPFELVARRDVPVATMNGHPAMAMQALVRCPR